MAFSVSIKPGTLTVDSHLKDGRNALPNLKIGDESVICHLTHGFNPGATTLDQAIVDQAWRARADFQLDTADKVEIDKFDFGFIQIMYQGGFLLDYAGRKTQLGSVRISPPIEDEVYLDSNPTHTPWTEADAARVNLVGDRITCFTGDHPAFLAKRQVQNLDPSFTGSLAIDNDFFAIVHKMHFLTVLAQFEKKTLQQEALASFRWRLTYHFEVKYKSGRPSVRNLSKIEFEPAKLGQPAFSPDEKKVFDARSGRFFNTVAPLELRRAMIKGSPARDDRPQWGLNIPADFFT